MKKLMILSFLLLPFLSGDIYGQRRRPITAGEIDRIVTEQMRERWQRRVEGVTQRFNDALTRESEANQQAEYAERHFPNTPIARGYRQAANAATMERARAELAYRLQAQRNPFRYDSETERFNEWYDKVMPDRSPQSRKGDLLVPRNSENRRDPSDRVERTISGYGYGSPVKGKIQDRLTPSGDNDRSGRTDRGSNSDSTGGSGGSDKKDWRDSQREWADRRP
jgi:hypothetical protein